VRVRSATGRTYTVVLTWCANPRPTPTEGGGGDGGGGGGEGGGSDDQWGNRGVGTEACFWWCAEVGRAGAEGGVVARGGDSDSGERG
jgi:hypothetical protein